MDKIINNQEEKQLIKISVRNLVEFILRSGDIDNRRTDSMEKNAMAEGSRIHRKIQGRMGSDYVSEVPLKLSLNYEKYTISVEGRADGIITNNQGVTIDEIKGVYANLEKFQEARQVHMAQAMCYGYIYAKLENLNSISIQLTYCNIETENIKRFKTDYTFEEIEVWFESVIEQYIAWAEFIVKEKELRNQSIKKIEFPFEYREGQRNIVVSVYKAIAGKKNLYIQAPTGVGKTISTVFPAVKAVGENIGDKIFYLTAKTITRTVAEETFRVLRKTGLHFKTVTITAKDKMCLNSVVECNPDKCSFAKGHYDRINAAIYELITNEDDISRETIEKYAIEYNVCPFEMSLDVSNFMDGIICDYNYVFDPNVYLKRYFSTGVKGDYIFLVDEAHNLVERAREMYSQEIVKEDFLRAKKIVKDIYKPAANGLERCNKELLAMKRASEDYKLWSNIDGLITQLLRLQTSLEKFLDDYKEFTGRDEILDIYFKVRNFLNIYELVDENYEIYSDYLPNNEFYLKLFCVNPSVNLSACMEKGISTVFFSATLLPVNYYKELLSGNMEDYAIYVDSPFDTNKRIVAVSNDVSSKYTRRGIKEYTKIVKYIEDISSICKGNYMVFFPSYKLMEEVFSLCFIEKISKDCEIICQTSNMNEENRESFLSRFNKDNEKTLLGFCVLGGIFSEGIDLKYENLIGSIIIGTGLPQICTEREILKNHYDVFGKNGFDYAYRYPGMNKVLQAAGRVIRTKDDYGVIALLDERFLERQNLMLFPREWSDYKIANINNVGQVIERFWRYV